MSVSSRTSEVIKNYALEKYLLELEVNGLTVVPPEVHGFPLEAIDQIVELLLDYAEAMTGFHLTRVRKDRCTLQRNRVA